MGNLFDRNAEQDDYDKECSIVQPIGRVKKTSIDQQTKQLMKTIELIGYEKDGTMMVCQTAMESISTEFQRLVNCFQAKPACIHPEVLKTFRQVISHASKLKDDVMAKNDEESKRKGNVTETKDSSRTKMKKTKQAEPTVTAVGETQTVPVESHQLATAFEVVRQLPIMLKVLQKWITSVDDKGGSRTFNAQTLDYINEEIKFDTVQVSSDNSITLSKKTVETLLQHSQEYLKIYEETDSYKRQTTGASSGLLKQHVAPKSKPNELNINQKVKQASREPKITFNERPFKYVQALDPLQSGATISFITTLQAELEQRRIKLSLMDVKSFNDDENGSNLVLVICNYHSRLQDNVKNTLKDIPGNRYHRVLLAVIHCKKERLLPSAPSKAELKDDKDFGDIPEVVDFAFDKDEPNGGIECEFNKRAFEMIEHLVESERLVSMPADASSGSSNKKKKTAV